MARRITQKAPEFIPGVTDINPLIPYLSQYESTDDEGRYLPWEKLKWRVEPREQAQNIWLAIKWKRSLQQRLIPLKDPKGVSFSYCLPPALEAKLHQITQIASATTAAVTGGVSVPRGLGVGNQFLVTSLIMEEAISSAQLEGAAVTREVAKKMLENRGEPKTEDERMILNNYLLLKQAERTCQQPLTLDLILEFHKTATLGTSENGVIPGVFRSSNDIYVEDASGDIAYQPPSFELIETRLAALCEFANTDHSANNAKQFVQPVIKAIMLHFMLGFEHPFRDGNGRTARALFYWFMLKNNYQLFKYVSISKILKSDPKGYGMSYMYTETDQNDLTYFIDYQLDTILRSFEELGNYLAAKSDQAREALHLFEHSRLADWLNIQEKDIIKKAIKDPGRIFTVAEVANDYDVSENTARSYLNVLLKHKLLLSSKDGRKVLYIAPSDLAHRLR